MSRTAWITLRVTPEEKALLLKVAQAKNMSLGDFVRQQIGRPRVRKTKIEQEKNLQIARIGNNLNQLAHWANTYKGNVDTLLILSELQGIAQDIKCI